MSYCLHYPVVYKVESSEHENDIDENDHETSSNFGHIRDDCGGRYVVETSRHVQVRVESVGKFGFVRQNSNQLFFKIKGFGINLRKETRVVAEMSENLTDSCFP